MNELDLMAAEVALEEDAVERARSRYQESLKIVGLENTAPGQAMVRRSIGAVIAAVEQWIGDAEGGAAGRDAGLAKFLAQYDADEVALVALRHCVAAVAARELPLAALAMSIVADLEAIDLEARLRSADPSVFRRYQIAVKRLGAKTQGTQQRNRVAMLKKQGKYTGSFTGKASFAWGMSEKLRVGVRLVEMVVECAGFISVERMARAGDRNQKNYVVPTGRALDWVENAHGLCEIASPVLYPMVVPPRPWQGARFGGYISDGRGFRRSLIRLPATSGYREEILNADLSRVTAAVNALQETRWTINRRVYEVLRQRVESGEGPTGVPMDAALPQDPPRPEFFDTTERKDWSEEQMEEYRVWAKLRGAYKDALYSYQSRARCVRSQLDIAEKMLPFPAIYFPHQLDFRGRAYPMPALLHPQGDDVAKGLLQFADATPLGKDGVKWLAIHGANSYGIDKVPFADRLKWTRENTEAILADADDPLRADALWIKADSPMVFLAFAFEWADLMRFDGNPEEFLSFIPVGLDGSCNGLQHFSALLRDEVGGRATNLVPATQPADIYSLVADEVRKAVEIATQSDDMAVLPYARFWFAHGITRQLVKRNTMTQPYGVTMLGMKDQLWEEIGGPNATIWKGHDGLERGKAVFYLAEQNQAAIDKVVVAAGRAMRWLRDAAGVFNSVAHAGKKGKGLSIQWTTHDGLLVQQKYLKRESVQIALFGGRIKLDLRPVTDGIDTRRQTSGISPNFIHSIDAAHMREVVRRMHGEGMRNFAMIHDSFGAPAGHVERMAQITRDAFADIHSEDLLAKVRAEFASRLPEEVVAELPPVPQHGTLDLDLVRQSPYFFA